MTRVIALIATIPPRARSVARLLGELAQQSRQPDLVALCLDGYGDAPAPPCALPVREYRTASPSGPGARWRVAADLDPDDLLVNIDDDYMISIAPNMLRALVAAAETGGGAAAAMGMDTESKRIPPGDFPRHNPLIYGAGAGLTVRVRHLDGLRTFAEEVIAAGGPDMLGPLGDDDALVSAHLWRRRIPIRHAATGIIHAAPNTQASSQTRARAAKSRDMDAQKRLLRKLTGWPWPMS